jgi:hypothetical protein
MRSLALCLTMILALTAAPQAQRKSSPSKKETRTYRGLLTAINDEELTIELSDKRALILKRDASTKFSKPGTKPGDTVSVEITDDEKGYLYALNVTLEKEGQLSEPERRGGGRMPSNPDEPGVAPDVMPRATTVTSGEQIDPDGGGPPRLKRGQPPPKRPIATPVEEPAAAPVSRFPAGEIAASAGDEAPARRGNIVSARSDGERPFIERARETAYSFVETLPNYSVKQVTTRYQNERAIDNLTCDLIVENGKERYQNLMRNGKLMKEKAEESGSWSSGEFASTLQDIFSSSTNATFKPRGSTTLFQRSAMLFDFTVEQQNSHWTIRTQQEQYLPGYQGTLWIDKETTRVLRVEMQARKIPTAFPLDKVESAVDYNFVKIGTQSVLLPVHADVLSCERGSRQCSHNAIDFRNYKKFGAESNVTFTP